MACRRCELALGIGCPQTSFDLVSAEFKIPLVKAQAYPLSCTKHEKQNGMHESGLPSGFSATGIGDTEIVKKDQTLNQVLQSQELDSFLPLQTLHETRKKQCGSQKKEHRVRGISATGNLRNCGMTSLEMHNLSIQNDTSSCGEDRNNRRWSRN